VTSPGLNPCEFSLMHVPICRRSDLAGAFLNEIRTQYVHHMETRKLNVAREKYVKGDSSNKRD
jgi:hypothetical protein